jgi:hypothetical protein
MSTSAMPQTSDLNPTAGCWAALVFAIAGLAGSLYLSMGMHLRACPLCFYQRTFVMSLVAVLGVGLLARVGRLGLVALPLAVGGLGVAILHVSLELRGKLECPPGLFDVGTAPQQSLGLFLVLTALVLIDAVRGAAGAWLAFAAAVIVGVALAYMSTIANPPPPPAPTQPYRDPIEICRPPYVPAS